MSLHHQVDLFTAGQWRDWFRTSLAKWHSVSADREIEPGSRDWASRSEAFDPFYVEPDSPQPVSDLVSEIEADLDGDISRAARGLGLLLDDWQVAADGAEAGAFLIALASECATPRLARRIAEMLKRPLIADPRGRDKLLPAMLDALRDRGSSAERRAALRILRMKHWLTPLDAAPLLPGLADGSLAKLAGLIEELAPELATALPGTPAITLLASTMGLHAEWRTPSRPRKGTSPHYQAALNRVQELSEPALWEADVKEAIRAATEIVSAFLQSVTSHGPVFIWNPSHEHSRP